MADLEDLKAKLDKLMVDDELFAVQAARKRKECAVDHTDSIYDDEEKNILESELDDARERRRAEAAAAKKKASQTEVEDRRESIQHDPELIALHCEIEALEKLNREAQQTPPSQTLDNTLNSPTAVSISPMMSPRMAQLLASPRRVGASSTSRVSHLGSNSSSLRGSPTSKSISKKNGGKSTLRTDVEAKVDAERRQQEKHAAELAAGRAAAAAAEEYENRYTKMRRDLREQVLIEVFGDDFSWLASVSGEVPEEVSGAPAEAAPIDFGKPVYSFLSSPGCDTLDSLMAAAGKGSVLAEIKDHVEPQELSTGTIWGGAFSNSMGRRGSDTLFAANRRSFSIAAKSEASPSLSIPLALQAYHNSSEGTGPSRSSIVLDLISPMLHTFADGEAPVIPILSSMMSTGLNTPQTPSDASTAAGNASQRSSPNPQPQLDQQTQRQNPGDIRECRRELAALEAEEALHQARVSALKKHERSPSKRRRRGDAENGSDLFASSSFSQSVDVSRVVSPVESPKHQLEPAPEDDDGAPAICIVRGAATNIARKRRGTDRRKDAGGTQEAPVQYQAPTAGSSTLPPLRDVQAPPVQTKAENPKPEASAFASSVLKAELTRRDAHDQIAHELASDAVDAASVAYGEEIAERLSQKRRALAEARAMELELRRQLEEFESHNKRTASNDKSQL